MAWFLYALLYPFLYSFCNVADKYLLEKKVKNYYSYGIIVGAIILFSCLVVLYFAGIPAVPAKVFLVAAFAGVCYGIASVAYYYLFSLKSVEASRMVGLAYLFPVVVVMLSRIFLNEQLSIGKYIAIGIAIAGALTLSMEGKLKFARGTALILTNVVLIGIFDAGSKYVSQYVTYWQAYALTEVPLSLVLLLPFLNSRVRKNMSRTMNVMPQMLVIQLLSFAGTIAFFFAVSQGPISIISSLGTLQPAFVFLITILLSVFLPHLIKEKVNRRIILQKSIGIAMIIASAVVLGM